MCLKDYIGIKHCSQTSNPASNLYLNQLAGMSTELIDKIANSEQETFLGVWDDVQLRALPRFAQDFQMYLFEHSGVGFNKTLFTTDLITKPRNYHSLPIDLANLRGVYVYLPISRYVRFDLAKVQVYIKELPVDPNLTIRIFDLQNETELTAMPFVAVQGINNIETNLTFELNSSAIELFIGIEANFETIQTGSCGWHDCEEDCSVNYWGISHSERALVLPATYLLSNTEINYEAVALGGLNGYGISLDSQVVCSIEPFLCENKAHLKYALMYLLGVEMLNQKLASNIGSRINYFTHGNLEQTKATRDMYEKEYVKAMKNAVRSLNIPDSGICFACNENSVAFTGHSLP